MFRRSSLVREPSHIRRRRSRIAAALSTLLLLAGAALLAYPLVSNMLYQMGAYNAISSYDISVASLSQEELDALWEEAVSYNHALGHPEVRDPWGYEEVVAPLDTYWDVLDPEGTGVMGYVEAESAGIMLPIYHGTLDESLQRGAGHIATTALPVGGESTHAVVTGHTGLPEKMLFTNLTAMRVGDVFSVHVLGRELRYEVSRIDVVEPADTSLLQPMEGRDYLTLLTCTPYGVNSHRLLVTGVPTDKEPEPRGAPIWVLAFVLLAFVLLVAAEVAAVWARRRALREAAGPARARWMPEAPAQEGDGDREKEEERK